jgi:hypothetical protein
MIKIPRRNSTYKHLTVWQKSINELKFQDVLTVDILIENCETFTKYFHSFDWIYMISATRRPCVCCSDGHSLSRQLVINSLHLVMPHHLCYQLINTNMYVGSGKLLLLYWSRGVYIPYTVLLGVLPECTLRWNFCFYISTQSKTWWWNNSVRFMI